MWSRGSSWCCHTNAIRPIIIKLESIWNIEAPPTWTTRLAREAGYRPFSLCIIHKEGLSPSSGNINRLMMMMMEHRQSELILSQCCDQGFVILIHSWPHGQLLCVRYRKLSNIVRPSDGWPKIYYLELLRASKGTLSRWYSNLMILTDNLLSYDIQ
jgi:hypothetical protein